MGLTGPVGGLAGRAQAMMQKAATAPKAAMAKAQRQPSQSVICPPANMDSPDPKAKTDV